MPGASALKAPKWAFQLEFLPKYPLTLSLGVPRGYQQKPREEGVVGRNFEMQQKQSVPHILPENRRFYRRSEEKGMSLALGVGSFFGFGEAFFRLCRHMKPKTNMYEYPCLEYYSSILARHWQMLRFATKAENKAAYGRYDVELVSLKGIMNLGTAFGGRQRLMAMDAKIFRGFLVQDAMCNEISRSQKMTSVVSVLVEL
ncbi:hypothetical protein HYFRA_00011749 [Hymenoscyphus fraxineus]|uniref:Uncharacterized protein n=1 Tax=Hymenoscyphus fraxineus TaxID=746836 RepID=A0A9N9L656_9HELO|nr:hypothetical protein HYFRA_00011749 [Hymenoscyphus fraxineus]